MKHLPNFLIVGAAKCGTTSMSEYLKQHPEIFISEVKEPRFLSSQSSHLPLNGPGDAKRESRYITDYTAYQQLFKSAGEYKAVGEASADTLYYYQRTIPAIKKYIGEQPKIIIMLRDPVKRAFSAYQHLVRDQRESLSFEEGLEKEEERKQKNYELIWYYRGVSNYYESVKSFIDSFDNVHIIINEDLRDRASEIFHGIFSFLEVDPGFSVNTSIRYNKSGVPQYQWLHQFLFEEHWLKKALRPITHRLTSSRFRRKTSSDLLNRNLQRMSIDAATAALLRPEFQQEKFQLERLLERELPWLHSQNSSDAI